MSKKDHRESYSVLDLYTVGSRMVDDYDEDAAVDYYMELHPDADEAAVRAELKAEIARREESGIECLIDPLTTPFSSAEEIKAEIEEIRQLPPGVCRDGTIELMESWLEDKRE